MMTCGSECRKSYEVSRYPHNSNEALPPAMTERLLTAAGILSLQGTSDVNQAH
jgi:hypothetical protein